jgi:hypothetical protein
MLKIVNCLQSFSSRRETINIGHTKLKCIWAYEKFNIFVSFIKWIRAFSKALNLLKSGSKIVPTASQKKEIASKILILQAVFDSTNCQ